MGKAVAIMTWRERLFGTAGKHPGTTRKPPKRNPYINIAKQSDQVGHSLGGLWDALKGRGGRPTHVCLEGHEIPFGQDRCQYGHVEGQ